MAKKRLTDKFVASVKAPKDKVQVDYFDDGFPALSLRVGHREKTWTLHRRDNGKHSHSCESFRLYCEAIDFTPHGPASKMDDCPTPR